MRVQYFLIRDYLTSTSIKLYPPLDAHLYVINFLDQQLRTFQTKLLGINNLAYYTTYITIE